MTTKDSWLRRLAGISETGRAPSTGYPRWLVRLVRIASRLGFLSAGVVIAYYSLRPGIPIDVSDKLVHFAGYAAWTFVSLIGVRRVRFALLVAVAIFVVSVLIEVIQPYVGRTGDALDALANATGVLFGGLLTIAARTAGKAALTLLRGRSSP